MAQFTNQAQLRYNNQVTNSNVAVGEILDVLSATKTAVVNTYSRNGRVTYVLSIINGGTTDITSRTISDNLGAYSFGDTTVVPLTYIDGSIRYYVNGALQPAPTVTAGTGLMITGISIPAGGNATVIYEAIINEFAPLGTADFITNVARITGDGANTVTASTTINTDDSPELSITKAISPVPVNVNGRVTYTFTIQNYGNTAVAAGDGAVVTDTFNPMLSNLAVTFNGTSWTSPTNYTYNETTGLFSTVAGQITVPAATYTQNANGSYTVTPGVSTLTVTGNIQ